MAAERSGYIARRVIDINVAGVNSAGNGLSFRLGTHNHGVEPVRRIVGNGYRFVDRVISNHTEYGAKNFLTGYSHVIFDVRENRGLDEPAFFMSARFFTYWLNGVTNGG